MCYRYDTLWVWPMRRGFNNADVTSLLIIWPSECVFIEEKKPKVAIIGSEILNFEGEKVSQLGDFGGNFDPRRIRQLKMSISQFLS